MKTSINIAYSSIAALQIIFLSAVCQQSVGAESEGSSALLRKEEALKLIHSENWEDRVKGYKILAREVDVPSQPDLLNEVFEGIRKETDLRAFPYVFWPLLWHHESRLDDSVMDRLFRLLEGGRPEIWYGAAETLQNLHSRWVHPDRYWRKRDSLTGLPRMRLEMAGSHSVGYGRELERMGEQAFPFLASQATWETYERSPALFLRACNMLAFLGDQRAIPWLIAALKRWQVDGEATSLAPGYLLRAINKLTARNYGKFGQDFDSMTIDSIKSVDWQTVIAKLDEDFSQ